MEDKTIPEEDEDDSNEGIYDEYINYLKYPVMMMKKMVMMMICLEMDYVKERVIKNY